MSLAYVRILRPVNCTMIGFAVIVGSVLVGGFASLGRAPWSVFAGYLTGFLVAASAMVLNDYADREIDSINEPQRPIPSGLISPKVAMAYGLLLAATGISLAAFNGLLSLLAAIVAWLLFLTYTTVGKKAGLLGNILVSVCVALPFLYGAMILGNLLAPQIAVFASIAFLTNLGREVNKGIVDISGDEAKGVKTIAVRYGGVVAAKMSAIFYVAAAAISPLPILLTNITIVYYIPIVLITDLGLTFSAYSIFHHPTQENSRLQKRIVLLWMLLGMFAFLAGAVR